MNCLIHCSFYAFPYFNFEFDFPWLTGCIISASKPFPHWKDTLSKGTTVAPLWCLPCSIWPRALHIDCGQ